MSGIVCTAECWTHYATEAYCSLERGHTGKHMDAFEGWEWE